MGGVLSRRPPIATEGGKQVAQKITRRRALGLIGVVGAGTAVAVGLFALPGEEVSAGPPDLSIGQHTCDQCHMIISDERFAAGWRADDGTQARFDDIGCMVARYRSAGQPAATLWVHDLDGLHWVRAASATFVLSEALHTPMAYGVAAFERAESAATFAVENGGTSQGWEPLLQNLQWGQHDG